MALILDVHGKYMQVHWTGPPVAEYGSIPPNTFATLRIFGGRGIGR